MMSMTLEGANALQRGLSEMPLNIQKKGIRRGMARTLTQVKSGIQKAAPVRTGALRRSFGKMTRITKEKKELMAWVGVRRDFQFDGPPKPTKRRKKGSKPLKPVRRIPRLYARKVEENKPFVQPTFEFLKPETERIFAREVEEGIRFHAAKVLADSRSGK